MKIVVFDIGGTWVRYGLFSEKGLIVKNKILNASYTFNDCVEDKIFYFVKIVKDTLEKFKNEAVDAISVSLGACMSHINGNVYFSAPIFGEKRLDINFLSIISKYIKKIKIYVINDVSALCYGYDWIGMSKQIDDFAVMTISSGVAIRRYNKTTKKIYFDRLFGIQGEIGHLPVFNPYLINETKNILCDCGVGNHFSAFSSGNGLNKILEKISNSKKYEKSILAINFLKEKKSIESIRVSLKEKCTLTENILNIFSYPIAYFIVTTFYFCPEIDKLFLCGGIIQHLGDIILNIVFSEIIKISYLYDGHFYRDRVEFIKTGEAFGLIGAGFYALNKITGDQYEEKNNF